MPLYDVRVHRHVLYLPLCCSQSYLDWYPNPSKCMRLVPHKVGYNILYLRYRQVSPELPIQGISTSRNDSFRSRIKDLGKLQSFYQAGGHTPDSSSSFLGIVWLALGPFASVTDVSDGVVALETCWRAFEGAIALHVPSRRQRLGSLKRVHQ